MMYVNYFINKKSGAISRVLYTSCDMLAAIYLDQSITAWFISNLPSDIGRATLLSPRKGRNNRYIWSCNAQRGTP